MRCIAWFCGLLAASILTAQTTIVIEKPMAPPPWALAERALLRADAEGARECAARYLDDRGYMRRLERWGGNDPATSGNVLHSRVRYFDPVKRRAGLPEDVAALVEKIRADDIVLTLVNTNRVEGGTVTVQTGAYAEHRATAVTAGGRTVKVDAPYFEVRLAPGAGETLTIGLKRYAQQPTLALPWDRGWMAPQ